MSSYNSIGLENFSLCLFSLFRFSLCWFSLVEFFWEFLKSLWWHFPGCDCHRGWRERFQSVRTTTNWRTLSEVLNYTRYGKRSVSHFLLSLLLSLLSLLLSLFVTTSKKSLRKLEKSKLRLMLYWNGCDYWNLVEVLLQIPVVKIKFLKDVSLCGYFWEIVSYSLPTPA